MKIQKRTHDIIAGETTKSRSIVSLTVFKLISGSYMIKDEYHSFDNVKPRAFSTEQKQNRNREYPTFSADKDGSMLKDMEEIEQRINELSAQKKMV